jgi:histone H3/H4
MGVTATPLAVGECYLLAKVDLCSLFLVDEARAVLESYLRQVLDRSAVHSEYREAQEIGLEDVLITLQAIGRPLYGSEPQRAVNVALQALTETSGEEEDDGEYVPMDDDEESSDEEDAEMETWEGKDEIEEEVRYLDRASFTRLVDVLNGSHIPIAEEVYSALQTSAEDYLSQLFSAAYRATTFAGRREVEEVDIKFAYAMSQVRF